MSSLGGEKQMIPSIAIRQIFVLIGCFWFDGGA